MMWILTKILASLGLLLICANAMAQSAGTVTYVYTNPQGTPLAEADASGNITAAFDYTPYGTAALGSPPNGPGYTGHVNDPETGLIYMKARYYDSSTGHFLSVDPKPLASGDVYNFDRYGYAISNPLRYVDPDGRYACGSNTNKTTCARIDSFVKTMNSSLSHLEKGSNAYKVLLAVSKHIGKLGDHNGEVLNVGSLGKNVIAQANSATLMTIDVQQASSLSAMFSKYNHGVIATKLTNAFGAEAVAHEGQHQLDYLNPSIGYPTSRATEHETEMNAYRSEIGVAKGLGISNDLYAPGALQEVIDARIKEAADTSTEYWCKENGC